ncbi:hypothetical protein CYMTET_18566, partial [Cymbomonas tetramitiformis]
MARKLRRTILGRKLARPFGGENYSESESELSTMKQHTAEERPGRLSLVNAKAFDRVPSRSPEPTHKQRDVNVERERRRSSMETLTLQVNGADSEPKASPAKASLDTQQKIQTPKERTPPSNLSSIFSNTSAVLTGTSKVWARQMPSSADIVNKIGGSAESVVRLSKSGVSKISTDVSRISSKTATAMAANTADAVGSVAKLGGQAAKTAVAVAADASHTMRGVQYSSDGTTSYSNTLDPKSKFFRTWDCITTLLLVFTAIVTPYEVAFMRSKIDALFFFNRFVDSCFLLDMIFCFFLPYQKMDGAWETRLNLIARHYALSWFPVDVVSVFPFDLLGIFMDNEDTSKLKVIRIVRLLRLAKLLRVLRAGRVFQRWESSVAVDYAMLELCKFILITIVTAHWLACAWHLIKVLEKDIGKEEMMDDYDSDSENDVALNWINNYAWIDGDARSSEKYLTSFYWSVATFSTLGYGDVVPTTDTERLFVILATVMGASVYAYIIGASCGIVAGMGERTTLFYKKMDLLNAMMRDKQLPQPLRVRLRDYFRFRHSSSSINEAHDLLLDMSPALRGQVTREVHERWISQVPFFRDLDQSFHTSLALCLNSEHFSANEEVIRQNEWNVTMFIVEKGMVACKGRLHTSGTTFGVDMLEGEQRRTYSAGTLCNTVCLALKRNALSTILQSYPEIKGKLRRVAVRMMVRDRVLMYAKAIRSSIGSGHVAKTLEGMFETDAKSMMYVHKFGLLKETDPEGYDKLVKSCIHLQTCFRGFFVRKRFRNMQTHMSNANSTSEVALLKVVHKLDLGAYLQLMDKEKVDANVLR